jgi:mono/diheme cytochrome c family protein
LAIFRWNGAAGPPVEDPRPLRKGRFWPDQLFMDTVASLLVLIGIVALATFWPPFLDAKADPTVQFTPYPAWYFLDLFGLLNLVPGNLEIVGAIIIPGAATTLLILLPWIDRSTTRVLGSRKFILWLLGVSLAIIWWLTIWSQLSIMDKVKQAGPAAPPAAVAAPSTTPAVSRAAKAGQAVYTQNCSSCHGAAGAGVPPNFPPLAGNAFVTGDPKQVILTVLNGKSGAIQVNGQTYNGQMPPWKSSLSTKDVANVVTYIRSALGANRAGPVKPRDVAKLKK